jgi:hypothetical protein
MRNSLALTCVLAVLGSTAVVAQPKPMEFSRKAECAGNMCLQYILAEGDIMLDSADRLGELLKVPGDGRVVIFNSPGGSVRGGMQLGRLIRNYGLDTAVNNSIFYYDRMSADRTEDMISREAQCASACTLAFLGGKRRTLGKGARFGLHGFRSIFVDMGEAAAQKLVATLMDYANEMGADREMIQIASATPAETMHWITRTKAVELHIDNSEHSENQWKLDAMDDGSVFGHIEKPISTEHGDIMVFLVWRYWPVLVIALECGREDENKHLISRVAGKTTASISGGRWQKTQIRSYRSGGSSCIAIETPVTLKGLVPSDFTMKVTVSLGWADQLMSMEEYLLEPIILPRRGIEKIYRAVERSK